MKTLESWLTEGPFTLALSSSFFGFYSHCAIVSVLYERGYFPAKITGTSAGALVGGALASGMSPEEFKNVIFSKTKDDYWDPQIGFGLLKGRKFLQILETHFVSSFEEAHVPLEVGVLDILTLKTHFMSTGSLPTAVFASCAVPGMFHPVKIGKRFYYDGGVFNKAGINYQNNKERILNIFLESDGLTGLYERKTSFTKLNPEHIVLQFQRIPKVDFRDLATGKIAYDEAYKRAQIVFTKTLETNIISA
jgi:NTE family protein